MEGDMEGARVGSWLAEGLQLGTMEGRCIRASDGWIVVGWTVGILEGILDGICVAARLGATDGLLEPFPFPPFFEIKISLLDEPSRRRRRSSLPMMYFSC